MGLLTQKMVMIGQSLTEILIREKRWNFRAPEFCDHFDHLTLKCHRCFKNAPNWMKFGLECGSVSHSKVSSFHQNTYRDGVKITESLTAFPWRRHRRRSSIEVESCGRDLNRKKWATLQWPKIYIFWDRSMIFGVGHPIYLYIYQLKGFFHGSVSFWDIRLFS